MPSNTTNSNCLNVGHLNICSLSGKIPDLTVFLSEPSIFHIFGITESRLKSYHPDKLLHIPNYSILRRDAQRVLETGVAVYIHDSINDLTRRRKDLECKEVECIWLEVKTTKASPLLVGIVYRNPDSPFPWYDDFASMFDRIRNISSDIVILGDFNINLFEARPSWETTLSMLGLQQIITDPTRVTENTSTLIDHIYTTSQTRVIATHVPQIGISDHYPVSCSLAIKVMKPPTKDKHTYIHYRAMRKFDKTKFLTDLHHASFQCVYNHTDPDSALTVWYLIFLSILNKHAPLRIKRVKGVQKPRWLNSEVKNAMKKRDDFKKAGNFEEFRKQRNLTKTLVREAQRQHFKNLVENKKDVASVWRALNTITKPNRTPPSTSITADVFNEHFLSAADTVLNSNNVPTSPTVSEKLKKHCRERIPDNAYCNIPVLSVFEVGKSISKMENKRSFGNDTISSLFLKIALPYIVEPLTYIFNLCIEKSTFPASWKIAKVVPLPKTKDLNDPNKFRPISLLPAVSKPFERHVHNHLYSFFDKYQLLHSLQSGFRPKHSCHTALAHLTDRWHAAIHNFQMTGAVFIDFSKAFDLVNHNLLIQKLTQYQVGCNTVSFFNSYLHDRLQYVYINGKQSDIGRISHGVPQGSILGPLLFSIYINDMPLHISDPSVTCSLFADDGAIDTSSSQVSTINKSLQTSLNEISEWCATNSMVPNPSKTECMLIATRQKHQLHPDPLQLVFNSQPIIQVSEHKHLGVILDNKLDWHAHIENVNKTLCSNLYLMSKVRLFTEQPTRKLFYHAYIQPHLDYASTVWDGCAEIHFNKLDRLHRRAVKLISDDTSMTTDEKMSSLDILPLKKSLVVNKCVMMWKVASSKAPTYLSKLFTKSKYPNRSGSNYTYVPPWQRLDLCKNRLGYSGAILWNSLPPEIASAQTSKTFRTRLRKHLVNNCLTEPSEQKHKFPT